MTIRRKFPALHTTKASLRHPVTALLGACVAMTLMGCESPLRQDRAGDNDRYYESLVAREIVKGTYGSQALVAGTIDGGVHEYARVDSPG
ncbi:MAG TPA: hypothetical protein VGN88_06665, partial [Phycisphaerae bacterium]